MKLSIIIPVHNGGENLKRSLESLAISTRAPDEVIIVDDASTDSSAEVARAFRARVIPLDAPAHGPAFARNRGAEIATGDVLVFFDADVTVHSDTLARIEMYFAEHPDLAALFGSYDDTPPARGWVSQYKNLAHHYIHQHSPREASTFWSGCGAIRRQVFSLQGGFDERYENASIEDIELGIRLERAGQRVWLCPEIQIAHLKQWSFFGLLRSDIFDRAVPWTRLILRDKHLPAALNLDSTSRSSALLVWIALLALVVGFVYAATWMIALASLALYLYLQRDFLLFLARRRGMAFAVAGIGLQLLYFIYSSLTFGILFAWRGLTKPSFLTTCFSEPRRVLWLLLLVTLLKGGVWSLVVPALQVNDEDQHFGYAQEIVRQRTIFLSPPREITEERRLLWDLSSPSSLSGQREPLDLSPAGSARINAIKSRIFTPDVRSNLAPPIWYPRFVNQHPPLYYALEAAVHQLGAARNILVRLEWMRLASVLMAVATVGCVYGAANVLIADRKWLPVAFATLVSFHPGFTFFTSAVTNSAMEYLCFAAVAWVLALVHRDRMNRQRGLILGLLLGAGLLVRGSFLTAIPLVVAIFILDLIRTGRKCKWIGWALVLLVATVPTGWWYSRFLGFLPNGADLNGGSVGDSASMAAASLIQYVQTYPWSNMYRALLRDWWGAFGWRDTFYSEGIYIALEIFTLLSFLALAWLGVKLFWRRFKRGDWQGTHTSELFVIAMGMLATISLVFFYHGVDYSDTISPGGFKIVGRYFLSPIAWQIPALAIAWTQFRRRWVVPILCAGMIALNLYALFGVIVPRYYGEQIAVRYEPTERFVPLANASPIGRTFATDVEISRVDVWLKGTPKRANDPATFALYGDNAAGAQLPLASSQMTAPFPTILRSKFPAAKEYRVELRGQDAAAALASDGELAVKVFYSVPLSEIPTRIAAVQPAAITASLILAVIASYFVALGLLVGIGFWVFARGARG